MSKSTFYTSIGYKILMALSGLFLMFFLLQHLVINLLSIFSPDSFNEASHFMGTNPLVQFLLQLKQNPCEWLKHFFLNI